MNSARHRYTWMTCLVLLALLARGIIPAGFMPGMAVTGKQLFPMVICTASGESTVYVGADKLPPVPVHHTKDAACPYAVALPQSLASAPPILPAPTLLQGMEIVALNVFKALQQASRPYQSQGPPALIERA